MTCPHQSKPHGKDTGRRLCALGRFHGKPFIGQCNLCIEAGYNQEGIGLGDIVEKLAKPIAKALRMPCLDKNGNLKPESGCGKRKKLLNRIRL
jgi:hypothetical protein